MASAPRGSPSRAGSGTRPVMGSASCGLVPQVTVGAMSAAVERHLAVEDRVGIATAASSSTRAPSVPVLALRRVRAALAGSAKVVSSGATMPARAPASMDMLQTVMRSSMVMAAIDRARVLDGVPDAAARADRGDDGEDHVLGGDAGGRVARHRDAHGLGLALPEALRGQHVLDLARADAEGERPERAVGRGVRVAAHQERCPAASAPAPGR